MIHSSLGCYPELSVSKSPVGAILSVTNLEKESVGTLVKGASVFKESIESEY